MIPVRLTPAKVATPEPSVTAEHTVVLAVHTMALFILKVTVLPTTFVAGLPDVSVAFRVTVPAYVPHTPLIGGTQGSPDTSRPVPFMFTTRVALSLLAPKWGVGPSSSANSAITP